MEKSMIERAILRKYGNNNSKDKEELADKYLRKIVQLPLHLPDPSDSESTNFLNRQLGIWEGPNRKGPHDHVKVNPKFQIVTATQTRFTPDGERRKKYIEEYMDQLKRELARSDTPTAEERFPQTEEQEINEIGGASEGDDAASEDEDSEDTGVSVVKETRVKIKEESTTEDKKDDLQQRQGICSYLRALLYSCNVQSHEEVAERTREDQNGAEEEQGEGSKSKRSFMDDISSIMSAMLIPKYTPKEQSAFLYLHARCARSRKLPREWKSLLAYHRLSWNIVYLTFLQEDVNPVRGWQVQLIAWIFVCWEWKELITILIRKWKKLEVLRNWKSEEGPSLREIVEHYIEEELTAEKEDTSKKEDDVNEEMEKTSGKLPEKAMTMTTISEAQVASTVSNLEEEDMEGDDYLKEVLRRVLKEQEEMREALKKSLKEQGEMRDMLKRLLKEQENKVEERCNENRKRMVKKYLIEEEETEGESSVKEYTAAEEVEEWNRLKETLRYYNVPMDGIQAFQKFRFFCEAGHLPWPLPQLD